MKAIVYTYFYAQNILVPFLHPFFLDSNFEIRYFKTTKIPYFRISDPIKKGIKGVEKYQNFLGITIGPHTSFSYVYNVRKANSKKSARHVCSVGKITPFLKGFSKEPKIDLCEKGSFMTNFWETISSWLINIIQWYLGGILVMHIGLWKRND